MLTTNSESGDYFPFDRINWGGRGRGRGRARAGPTGPPRVPEWSGSRTPSGSAQAQGARTPAWGNSSRSKSWHCEMFLVDLLMPCIAPAWSGGNSSSRTPMWRQDGMSGGRTPAYSGGDGSRTVNPYADGNRTAYGGATGSGGVRLPHSPSVVRPSHAHFYTAHSSLGPGRANVIW
jgi:transcription elongation factor